jgi:hypothetical protein
MLQVGIEGVLLAAPPAVGLRNDITLKVANRYPNERCDRELCFGWSRKLAGLGFVNLLQIL